MRRKKVAIIGANGQLGSDLCEVFSRFHDVIPLTHADIEITDIEMTLDVLKRIKPDIILNTAAYHNVPKCEQNPELSFKVNSLGALNVAKIADELKVINVYYSTDYVFDGVKKSPYIEDDRPNPLNVYGSTKLLGEYYTLNYSTKSYVIRISGIYGKTPCRAKGGNFITTMVKLAKERPEVKVVNDEILTPTPTRVIAEKTVELIETDAFGLYHLTCEGECSWYEFAKVIFETLDIKTPLYPVSAKDFPSSVKRPSYSVLENLNFKKLNLSEMPFWKDALIEFLKMNYL